MDDRGTHRRSPLKLRKNPFWTGEAAIVRPFSVKPDHREIQEQSRWF